MAYSDSILKGVLGFIWGREGITIGLFTDAGEVSDGAYKRQPCTFAVTGRNAMNTSEVHFGPWSRDLARQITTWAAFDGNDEIAREALEVAKQPERGDYSLFLPGALKAAI